MRIIRSLKRFFTEKDYDRRLKTKETVSDATVSKNCLTLKRNIAIIHQK